MNAPRPRGRLRKYPAAENGGAPNAAINDTPTATLHELIRGSLYIATVWAIDGSQGCAGTVFRHIVTADILPRKARGPKQEALADRITKLVLKPMKANFWNDARPVADFRGTWIVKPQTDLVKSIVDVLVAELPRFMDANHPLAHSRGRPRKAGAIWLR